MRLTFLNCLSTADFDWASSKREQCFKRCAAWAEDTCLRIGNLIETSNSFSDHDTCEKSASFGCPPVGPPVWQSSVAVGWWIGFCRLFDPSGAPWSLGEIPPPLSYLKVAAPSYYTHRFSLLHHQVWPFYYSWSFWTQWCRKFHSHCYYSSSVPIAENSNRVSRWPK